MNNKLYEAIVVGGGPAGLSAGIELARHGIRVLLIEQKKGVGVPVQCGEAVSRLFMEEAGFAPDLPWVVAKVFRLELVLPDGRSVILSREGYCIRRDVFDRWLFDEYVRLGGGAHLGEKVIGAEETGAGIRLRTTKGEYVAGFLVAADGSSSRLAISLGMRGRAECISAIQYKFRPVGDWRVGTLSFYISSKIAGGYFWIFPRGGEVSVGACGSNRSMLKGALENFCRMRGVNPEERISVNGGLIPCSPPSGRMSSDRAVVCGDAAGLVHPASKGGIHLAVHSGRAGGRAVLGAIRSGAALSSYADGIGRIEAFREPCFSMLRSSLRFTDREYNIISEAAGGSRDRLPLSGLLLHPAAWPLLPRLLGLYRAYRKTARWTW